MRCRARLRDRVQGAGTGTASTCDSCVFLVIQALYLTASAARTSVAYRGPNINNRARQLISIQNKLTWIFFVGCVPSRVGMKFAGPMTGIADDLCAAARFMALWRSGLVRVPVSIVEASGEYMSLASTISPLASVQQEVAEMVHSRTTSGFHYCGFPI